MRRGLKKRILLKIKMSEGQRKRSQQGEREMLMVAGKPRRVQKQRKGGQLCQMLLRSGKIKVNTCLLYLATRTQEYSIVLVADLREQISERGQ